MTVWSGPWILPYLHEVKESIFSEEEVKQTQFTAWDVFKLIFAELMAWQKAGIVPIYMVHGHAWSTLILARCMMWNYYVWCMCMLYIYMGRHTRWKTISYSALRNTLQCIDACRPCRHLMTCKWHSSYTHHVYPLQPHALYKLQVQLLHLSACTDALVAPKESCTKHVSWHARRRAIDACRQLVARPLQSQ